MKRLGIVLIGWMLGFTPMLARGEATLISVQKGQSGQRRWVVLTFNQAVVWNGLSRPEEGKLSLYVMGQSGGHRGQTWTWNSGSAAAIGVRDIDQQPGLIGIDCTFDPKVPVAVVKRPRHLIVSFDDDRFVQEAFSGSADISATPGMFTAFRSETQEGQALHTLQFDGSYDWVAFVQPAKSVGALFIDGAGIGVTQKERHVAESELTKAQFFPVNGRQAFKTVLYFEPGAGYSVIKRSRQLLVQTQGHEVVQTLARAEASPNEVDSALFNLADAGETQPQKQDDLAALDALLEAEPQKPVIQSTGTASKQEVIKAPAPVKTETAPQKAEKEGEEDPDFKALESMRKAVEATPDTPKPVIRKTQVAPKPEPVSEEQPEWRIPWSQQVSFRFNDSPLKDALRTVARVNQLNMVIGDGVVGKVTMDLHGVTLRQAMNMLVYTNDCEYNVIEGIITIKTVKKAFAGGMETRVYRLKYAEAENLAPVVRQVVSDDSLVQVYHPEFLNFEKAGKSRKEYNEQAVQGVRRSSVLVVTERPELIQKVDQVIAELDHAPVQILIHSKLVEMSPINTNEIGINWDKTLTMALNQVDILDGGDKVNYSALNTAPGSGGSMTLGHLTASKFEAVLDFLNEQTETRLKSNPTLMAMDNEESSIGVGTTVPIPKIQRGFGGQQDMVTFDYKEVNIQLNVTPHVTEENMITMFVNPVIEEITGWVDYEGNRAPITDKRAVNSIVTIRSGETVVIGGLVKTQKTRTLKKVWLLGNIPLLGKLFQHESYEDKQTDLMIFITPTIVENAHS